MNDTDKILVIGSLEAVPSHREDALSVQEIANHVASECQLDETTTLTGVTTTLSFLDLFDILVWCGDTVKIKGQIPNYFRISLLWYLKNNEKIVGNWDRSGTSKNLRISNLLDRGPYLLRILEERRQHLSAIYSVDPMPSRIQECSVILIKAVKDGKAYFLHQWDQKAERYQMIGGKKRENETSAETARREFLEEIADSDLVYGRDFELNLITTVEEIDISRTYGALTKYEISVYRAMLNIDKLKLAEPDRWLSIDEVMKGKTNEGKDIAGLCRKLNAEIPDMLIKMSESIKLTNSKSLLDYLEAKPGLFGIRFDLKGFFQRRKS